MAALLRLTTFLFMLHTIVATSSSSTSLPGKQGGNPLLQWHYDEAGHRCNLPQGPPQLNESGEPFPTCTQPVYNLPPGQRPTHPSGQPAGTMPPPRPPPRRPGLPLGWTIGLSVGGTVLLMTVLLIAFARYKRRRFAHGQYERLEAELEMDVQEDMNTIKANVGTEFQQLRLALVSDEASDMDAMFSGPSPYSQASYQDSPPPYNPNHHSMVMETSDAESALSLHADHDIRSPGPEIQPDSPMLEAADTSLNEQDAQGNTLLAWAVILNKPDHVTVLIRRGADVSLPDNTGQTPLHKACMRSDDSRRTMVLALLQAGADCNAPDADGMTPMMLACMHNEVTTVRSMLTHYRGDATVNDSQGMNCVSHAACHSAYAVLSDLITGPGVVTVDSSDDQGRQPLHWACVLGDTELLTMVLEMGPAKLTSRLRSGENALHLAAREGNEACMNMLLTHAHPNQRLLLLMGKTNQGLSAAELCQQQGYPMLSANLTHILTDCQNKWQSEHGSPMDEDDKSDKDDNACEYRASAEDSDSSDWDAKRKSTTKVGRGQNGKKKSISNPSRAAYMRSRRQKLKQSQGRTQSDIQQLEAKEAMLLAALQELRQDREALQQASGRRLSVVKVEEDQGVSSI
eukprot:m.166468 g.166468  ORF g.166468 m.166468 type:complete len:628 (+) comp16624_c0_seq3:179-2062(+)